MRERPRQAKRIMNQSFVNVKISTIFSKKENQDNNNVEHQNH